MTSNPSPPSDDVVMAGSLPFHPKDIQQKINEASPKLVGLAQYEHCLDPCEFLNGKPGWSHVGSLSIDGVTHFAGSMTLTLGPLDVSATGSVPGFAQLTVSGNVEASFSGSISGSLVPKQPTSIKPKNRPAGKASAHVDLPLTGSVSAGGRQLIVGSSGLLEVTVNKVLGPVQLEYEAEETCH